MSLELKGHVPGTGMPAILCRDHGRDAVSRRPKPRAHTELISSQLGWLEGHGSDGDERRAKLMKERMCVPPSQPGRLGLDAPFFTMSARHRVIKAPRALGF